MTPHLDITASVGSFLGTLGLAAGALPVPENVPSWLPYATTIIGPVLIALMHRILAAKAARDRSLAEAKRKRAAQIRGDTNPENDAEASKLEDDADALEAQADAEDAFRKKGQE